MEASLVGGLKILVCSEEVEGVGVGRRWVGFRLFWLLFVVLIRLIKILV